MRDRITALARTLDRRRFLRLSPVLPFAAASVLETAPPQPNLPRDTIVIVGAGLAGLRAAALLRKAGRPVVVLEARGSTGGRVRTIRTFDEELYAEAGPIRIPEMHQTVLQLAREHGLNLVPFESSTGAAAITIGAVTARLPGELKKATAHLSLKADEVGLDQGGLLRKYVGDLAGELGTVGPAGDAYARWRSYDALTWPEWLKSRGASAGAITLMTLGGDSRELSALYVLRQFALLQKTTQFYKIRGGMDQLPRAMTRDVQPVIRYRAPVVRIEHGQTDVTIDYLENARTKNTIRAARVILAIPFSTLRTIAIHPPLSPEKARAVAELPYFPATRFLLQMRSSFWQEQGFSGSARSDQRAEMWDCTYDLAGTRGILGATAGGALGRSASGMTRDRAVKLGVDIVARTFPPVRTHFEKGTVYRWAQDLWARGAFAVFHPGQMTSMVPHIARPEGRLHFCGEHTSPWSGWMEGALESGERAAREVLG